MSAIQTESGDEAVDIEQSSETLMQTNQGGMPLYEITEQSQRLEDFHYNNNNSNNNNMGASRKGQELEREIEIEQQCSSMMQQSSFDAKMQQRLTAPTRSGDLPTNPTFISVHQADAEIDEFLQMQDQQEQQQVTDMEFDDTQGMIAADHGQQLFVWGNNSNGQLGLKNGNFGRYNAPETFSFQHRVLMISCGAEHSAIVTDGKQLFVMGSNQHAQLGMGSPSDIPRCTVPTLVQSLAHIQVQQVACGARHTIAIGTEIIGERMKSCFSWGDNTKGQTGLQGPQQIQEPRRIDFPSNSNVKISKISAGQEHSFFLDTKLWQVFACGETRQGQLGIGRRHEIITTPQLVENLINESIVEVSAGDFHTLALNYDGKVLATGSNVSGQLGLGNTESQHEFCMIPELSNILHVCASSHSAAIDCDGRLYRWGQGVKGVYLAPLKIASPRPTFIDEISMGYDFGVVKNKNGELFSYGLNSNGQLGLGDSESRSTLNSLVELNQQGVVQALAAGSNFAVCLVDTTMESPQEHFMADNHKISESAPTRKQLPGMNSDGQKTSVTEFKDSGDKDMFAVISEYKDGSSTIHTGAFNSQNDTKVSYRPKTQKVFSQQGLPIVKEFNDYTRQFRMNESSDLGTIQTHQTAQNIREMHAIRHEISGEEYYQDANSQTNLYSQKQSSSRPPRTINPQVKPSAAVTTQTRRQVQSSNLTMREPLMREKVDSMVPPYTSSPFHVSRSNIAAATPNQTNMATSHQQQQQQHHSSSSHHLMHQKNTRNNDSRADTASMSAGGVTSNTHLQQVYSGQNLHKYEESSQVLAYDEQYQQQQQQQDQYRDRAAPTKSASDQDESMAQKYHLRSNFARSQSNSQSRSRERNTSHQNHLQPPAFDANKSSDTMHQQSVTMTMQQQNNSYHRRQPQHSQQPQHQSFNLSNQRLNNQYAGLDRIPVRQTAAHQDSCSNFVQNVVPRSQSPLRQRAAENAHKQLPSFSANVPNQFRSRSSINVPSSRGTHARVSMETTGQFVSQYAQSLLINHNQSGEASGHRRESSYPDYHQITSEDIYSGNVVADADQQQHHLVDPKSHGRLLYNQKQQFNQSGVSSTVAGEESSFDQSNNHHHHHHQLRTLEVVQNQQDRDYNDDNNMENNCLYRQGERQQFLTSQDFNGTTDFEQTGSHMIVRAQQETVMIPHGSSTYYNDNNVSRQIGDSDWQNDVSTSTRINNRRYTDVQNQSKMDSEMQFCPLRDHSGAKKSNHGETQGIRHEMTGHLQPQPTKIDYSYQNSQPQLLDLHNSFKRSTTPVGPQNRSPLQLFTGSVRYNHQPLSKLQETMGESSSTNQFTTTNHQMTTNTLDTLTTREVDENTFKQACNRSKSSNQEDQHDRLHIQTPCCTHLDNNSLLQQKQQMRSFDYRGGAVSQSMVNTPGNQYHLSRTPTAQFCCRQSQLSKSTLMTTGFEHQHHDNHPPHRHQVPSCNHHRQQAQRQQETRATRSQSRCPICRKDEETDQSAFMTKSQNHANMDAKSGRSHHNTYCHQQSSQQYPISSQDARKAAPPTPIAVSSKQQCSKDHRQQSSRRHQKHQHQHQKDQQQNHHVVDRKLRKKYKKLKHESARALLEQQQDAEKLKLRIHELQSMLQQREAIERKQSMQQSEGYQGLVHKYSTELSALQEKTCVLERTIVARESQNKIITQENEAHQRQCSGLSSELEKFKQENADLKASNTQIVAEIDGLRLNAMEKERNVGMLREQLEQKTRSCQDAEVSLSHMNKTLDDLRTNFNGAKLHADSVMAENDQLRADVRSLNGNLEVYSKQMDSLRQFVEELEANNKELVRFIDNKNFLQANDYRTKVANLLNRQRNYTAGGNVATLRAPDSVADMEEVNETVINNNPLLHSCNNNMSRSHSPVTRTMDKVATFNEPQLAQARHNILSVSSTEKDHQRTSSPPMPHNYGASVAEFGRASDFSAQENQYKTQQHCVRRKSPQKQPSSLGAFTAPDPPQFGSQTTPDMSNSRARYLQIIEKERRDMEQARNSLPQVLEQAHKEAENPTSPHRNYLAAKAGQLLDQVTQHKRSSIHESRQVDPRDRLRAEQPSYNAARNHQTSRSVSPAQIIHQTSRFSNNERSISAGGGRHNGSVDSQTGNNPSNFASAHFASQDSLKVQYQKVTDNLPTFHNRKSKLEDVSKSQPKPRDQLGDLPEQSKIQYRLPDIQSVLASSPGKSQKFQSRSKSPFRSEIATPNGLNRKQSEAGFNEDDVTESYAQFNSAVNNSSKEQSQQPAVYPKVTSTMMRSQLNMINESLAQLKRNRIQLEGQMVHYEVEHE